MITATWRVERLETSDSEYRALKHAGLNTFGELAALSGEELAAKAGISRNTAEKLLKQIRKITREEEGTALDELPTEIDTTATAPNIALDKLNDLQNTLEHLRGFALVLMEAMPCATDMRHAQAAACVAEEIYSQLGEAIEAAVALEEELLADASEED